MEKAHFEEVCHAAARALQVDVVDLDNGRCSLTIDGLDVLIDLDERADALDCYVDLGDPSQHDRAQVCELLLALNLSTHADHGGAYGFARDSGRAIFCANLTDAASVTADELADALRYYINETDHARQLVSDPAMHGDESHEGGGTLIAALLA